MIAERRAALQLAGLEDDPDLGKLAGAYARALAAGEARQAANARLDAGLDCLGGRFSVVKTNVMVVGAVSQIAGAKNVEDRDVTHLGVGVAQGRDPELGEQALFLVLLLGRSR